MGLDGVELVMAFEEGFGISISDEAAAHMLTPADVINWIGHRVNALADRSPCFSMIEFHRVRAQHFARNGIPRRAVRLDTLMPEGWIAYRTVRDEVTRRVELRAKTLPKRRKLDPRWKRSEVCEVVRQIVREQIGVQKFSDTDHFIRDLGID